MSVWPPIGGASRERDRVARHVGKAVEKGLHQASETWPQHRDERGLVGDLVGVLQRNINDALANTGVRVTVRSTTIPEEMDGGADLDIRAAASDEPGATNGLTKRIVLQAKREEKLKKGAPSKIREERRRLANQIVKMRRNAPDASGVLILRPQGPTVYRNPERRNIAVKRLLDTAEPLSKSVADLISCRWGQVVPSSDLALLEIISREYIDRGAPGIERIVITLITPRDLLRLEAFRIDRLTLHWQPNSPP